MLSNMSKVPKALTTLPSLIKTLDDAYHKGYREGTSGPGIADYWPSSAHIEDGKCPFVKAWMRGFSDGDKSKHANDNAGCLN